MQRVPVPLVGPSNVLRATNADIERTVNWYVEITSAPGAKVQGYHPPFPGLLPFAQVLDEPGQAIFSQDGRTFVIVGNTFAEVLSNQTTRQWGIVQAATPTLPASMVSNGTAGGQLLLCSGGAGYLFSLTTSVFTEITEANYPSTGFPVGNCLQVEFLDGYFIALQANSRKFFISELYDGTDWDPLDVFERSQGSDNFAGMIRSFRELWLLGTRTGEVWSNTGDADTPLAPVPGVFVETGAAGPSMSRAGGTIVWVQSDERGSGMVMAAEGYTPTRISTHAVEHSLQTSEMLSSAKLFTYQLQGHAFTHVNVPDLTTTWVYDWSTKLWTESAYWNTDYGQYEADLPVAHAYGFGKQLVVTRDSGVIYALDLNTFDNSVAA